MVRPLVPQQKCLARKFFKNLFLQCFANTVLSMYFLHHYVGFHFSQTARIGISRKNKRVSVQVTGKSPVITHHSQEALQGALHPWHHGPHNVIGAHLETPLHLRLTIGRPPTVMANLSGDIPGSAVMIHHWGRTRQWWTDLVHWLQVRLNTLKEINWSLSECFSARLWYLQCISNRETTVLY